MTNECKGKFSFEGLDRLMHERARLGILSSLASSEVALTFSDLKELCDLTDGNLSRHLKALEEAGIIVMEKTANNGRPMTLVTFSKEGLERFLDYVDVLESIVQDSSEALRSRKSTGTLPLPETGSA